jgi:serine/threonine protein kinase
MMQLEQKSIIHRDLGARNLLVSESDGRYIVKLADLGLSRDIINDIYEASEDNTFPVKVRIESQIDRKLDGYQCFLCSPRIAWATDLQQYYFYLLYFVSNSL